MNDVAKWANFASNGARETEFLSSRGGSNDEHNVADFVEIAKISVMQNELFFTTEPFDYV